MHAARVRVAEEPRKMQSSFQRVIFAQVEADKSHN